MKNRFFPLLLLGILTLAFQESKAQTLNVTPSAVEVIAAGANSRAFYDLDEVFFVYKASTVKVSVYECMTGSLLFYGDTSLITVSGATYWTKKLTKFAGWCQDATTTTGLRYFLPKRNVQYVYRNGTNTVNAVHSWGKKQLWTGVMDSLKITGISGVSAKLAYLRAQTFLDNFRHRLDIGDAPTIAAGAAAGGSPTVTISGTGSTGTITITPGSSPLTSGVLATLTLPVTYPTKAVLTLTPGDANSNAAAGKWFVTGTASTCVLNASSAALTVATAYTWTYSISGY